MMIKLIFIMDEHDLEQINFKILYKLAEDIALLEISNH